MKTLHTSLIAMLSAASLAAPVHAQEMGSTSITSQATVPRECVLNATRDLALPNYDILDTNSGANVDLGTGNINIQCTGGTTMYVQIGSGLNPVVTACGGQRRMKNTTENTFLSYHITRPSSLSWWAAYVPGRCDSSFYRHTMYNVRNVDLPISGYVEIHQYGARAGNYSDTVVIYLTF